VKKNARCVVPLPVALADWGVGTKNNRVAFRSAKEREQLAA
jgi:hypothetical protein